MPLAISTSWNAYRCDDAQSLLLEIKELGFSEVELSFNLTAQMTAGIPGLAQALGLKIVSLHNYCPIPDGFSRQEALPDCYALSSCDREERMLALKYTKRTIDTAGSLGARAVVLHCGRVEIPDKTREFIYLYGQGAQEAREYKDLKQGFIEQRSRAAGNFLSQALDSLEELSRYARKQGVALGIENRFYYREIPCFEEIGIILERFKGANIFYWHDTGHARVMQNLGFLREQDYLKSYGRDMLGIHLHNISGCVDHQAPVRGELNFADLRPYLKKETIKVIEAHHPASAEDIRESRELLENIFTG